ncbi:MAG: tail collar protein [Hyphomicrobiales bacterium]|nr:tail collar protein [Hyphomicrobiales bacterium]
MVFVPFKDRVMETSISNSQTVFALAGAVDASFNRFSAWMAVNDTTLGAVVEPGVAFAAGVLTYSATNQVTVSAAFDSKGTFSSGGTKEVFMGLPAHSALTVDGPQSLSSTQQGQVRASIGVDKPTLPKSANYTAVLADYGALINLSGSATLALTAAATLGDGWKCDIRNTSTGMWVIDPNGSETINGQATFNVYPGENLRMVCDGAGFHTVGTGTGLILMDTQIASNAATMEFKRFDPNRFRKYKFVFEEVHPSTALNSIACRVSVNGGSSYVSSGYRWGNIFRVLNSPSTVGGSDLTSQSQFSLETYQGNDPGYGISGEANLTCGSTWTFFDADTGSIDGNTGITRNMKIIGTVSATAINAMGFFATSGNINGTIRQYGYSK